MDNKVMGETMKEPQQRSCADSTLARMTAEQIDKLLDSDGMTIADAARWCELFNASGKHFTHASILGNRVVLRLKEP